MPLTVLAIASFHKGQEFLRQCKREGCRVLLLTSKSLQYAEWPEDDIDNIYFIPDRDKTWDMTEVIHGVSFLARTEEIDRIVALDDYDVEKAAQLREHLRIPGMGETTVRYFRDKLAMRMRAKESGIDVPEFIHVLNHARLREFLNRISPPWVLKPRLEAGAVGIRKIHLAEEFWREIDILGNRQSYFLLEQFVPGDVFHVDSIVYDFKVAHAVVSRYGKPPMEISHEGRVFSTMTLRHDGPEAQRLLEMNARLLTSMGLMRGVSHSEFIQRSDGSFVFLETSSRPGGANIVELVEAATGLNLWAELAKMEVRDHYQVRALRDESAALLLSLAKQEWPDMTAYNDPEVVWTLRKKSHAGLILRSSDHRRVEQLLTEYTERFYTDFFARQPPTERATE